ncbi:MAG: transcription antitermination factor NusB [Acidobacteria bacterium]|nr:transcription antitermination factor NusB [Acidobacteriota bacterium]
MPSRHRSRQRALQILFQLDLRKLSAWDALDNFYDSLHSSEHEQEDEAETRPPRDEFMETLVRGTAGEAGAIDEKITAHSAHWRMERMPAVDRNILRMAVYEMMHQGTPAAVVIDEALELARRFSGEESVGFINGVLDAVRRDLGQDRTASGATG